VNKFVFLKQQNFGVSRVPSQPKKKAAGKAAPNGEGRQRPQVLGRALCRCGFFNFGRLFFSLDITRPAFSVFNFIGLFAHTSVFTSAT
jgi:hypothetical protein